MRPATLCARSITFIAATLLSGTASAGLVTRGDIKHLALVAMDRGGNDGTSALASELCGVTVDGFGGGGHDGWPEAMPNLASTPHVSRRPPRLPRELPLASLLKLGLRLGIGLGSSLPGGPCPCSSSRRSASSCCGKLLTPA
jgi:hypothetical protein